jgi:hypothetical protein
MRKQAVESAADAPGVPLALKRNGRALRNLYGLHDHLEAQGFTAEVVAIVLSNPVLVDRYFQNRNPDGTIRDPAAELRFGAWLRTNPASRAWPGGAAETGGI